MLTVQSKPNVLISGAGIAGLSLAYWLAKAGMSVSVVERAAKLRAGGQAIDFRGPTHLRVLKEMGISDRLIQAQTRMAPIRFLGNHYTPTATLSSEFAGGDIEVLRGTLVRTLASIVPESVRYMFNDTITFLQQTSDCVTVSFHSAPTAKYDIVVGADGLRSNVRKLIFAGAENITLHGYAIVSIPVPKLPWKNHVGNFLSQPGRCVGISGTVDGDALRATFFFALENGRVLAHDSGCYRKAVLDLFQKDGWLVPNLLPLLANEEEIYADVISSVELEDVWRGRVVLLGDAAHGGTIGAMGTGVALVGAFILAQELLMNLDYDKAFQRYQHRMEAYARRCRRGAAAVGPFFAPKTALGIWQRNVFLRLLELLPGKGLMERLAAKRADSLDISPFNIAGLSQERRDQIL